MALDYKSRLTTGAFSGAGGRELVRRIARHVLRLLLAASVACGGPWSAEGSTEKPEPSTIA